MIETLVSHLVGIAVRLLRSRPPSPAPIQPTRCSLMQEVAGKQSQTMRIEPFSPSHRITTHVIGSQWFCTMLFVPSLSCISEFMCVDKLCEQLARDNRICCHGGGRVLHVKRSFFVTFGMPTWKGTTRRSLVRSPRILSFKGPWPKKTWTRNSSFPNWFPLEAHLSSFHP